MGAVAAGRTTILVAHRLPDGLAPPIVSASSTPVASSRRAPTTTSSPVVACTPRCGTRSPWAPPRSSPSAPAGLPDGVGGGATTLVGSCPRCAEPPCCSASSSVAAGTRRDRAPLRDHQCRRRRRHRHTDRRRWRRPCARPSRERQAATFTATYHIERKLGPNNTNGTVVKDGTELSVTVATSGSSPGARSDVLALARDVRGRHPRRRISNYSIGSAFWASAPARALRVAMSRRSGPAVPSTQRIGNVQAAVRRRSRRRRRGALLRHSPGAGGALGHGRRQRAAHVVGDDARRRSAQVAGALTEPLTRPRRGRDRRGSGGPGRRSWPPRCPRGACPTGPAV